MASEMGAVLLTSGSIWKPVPWEPPYLAADPGSSWPDDSYASAVFTDSSGATIVSIDGDVTAEAVTFEADPSDMDQVPAGANFAIVLDTPDGPVGIRHGKVIRKEPFYTTLPSSVIRPPMQFADSFQRTALGRKWVGVGPGRTVIHNNSGLSLPNGISPYITFFQSAALRYYAPFNTDSVRVSVNVVNPLNLEAGKTSVVVCADINFTSGLAVQFETGPFGNNFIHMGTLDGPTTVVYQGSQVNNVVANGDNYTIAYSDLTKTLAVYKGTGLTPVASWTDSSEVVPHGPGYQYFGFSWNASLLTQGIQITSFAGKDDL
jgi:hypothetical protein